MSSVPGSPAMSNTSLILRAPTLKALPFISRQLAGHKLSRMVSGLPSYSSDGISHERYAKNNSGKRTEGRNHPSNSQHGDQTYQSHHRQNVHKVSSSIALEWQLSKTSVRIEKCDIDSAPCAR